MKNFAEVKFNKVVNILVSEDQPVMEGSEFIEFKYDGSIRKNPAVIGGDYREENDAFIDPKPYPSWVLNTETFKWESPEGLMPTEGVYIWDEADTVWKQVS
jgi:hypothetical protein